MYILNTGVHTKLNTKLIFIMDYVNSRNIMPVSIMEIDVCVYTDICSIIIWSYWSIFSDINFQKLIPVIMYDSLVRTTGLSKYSMFRKLLCIFKWINYDKVGGDFGHIGLGANKQGIHNVLFIAEITKTTLFFTSIIFVHNLILLKHVKKHIECYKT